MEVEQAIRMKRAVREFRSEPLPDSSVEAILQAGRRAQSAKNIQPWVFLAIRERSTLEALSNLGTYAGHLAGAALGVVILTPDPEMRWSVMFDAGQSASYMQLAAWEMGIGSCLATIYELEAARDLLGFPAEYHAQVALSFGYPADPDILTRPLKSGGRKIAAEVIQFEHWKS